MESQAVLPLDMNGIFNVEVRADGDAIRVGLPTHPDYGRTFAQSLVEQSGLLRITVDGRPVALAPQPGYYYSGRAPKLASGSLIEVRVGDNLCQRFTVVAGGVHAQPLLALPVELVRGISDDPNTPVPRLDPERYRYALHVADTQKLVSTHTHFSADDPKPELLDLAIERNIPIPRRFLDKLGIDYSPFAREIEWREQPTIRFFPKRHEQRHLPAFEPATGIGDLHALFARAGKGEAFKRGILRGLSIPIDEIRHQGGFEDIYEVLEFITKLGDPGIIAQRIVNAAHERARHENCAYMEIASGSVLKKEFLLGWQQACARLREEGCDLRTELKLGVPRHMPYEEMVDNFRRAIEYHKRGVCCGVDIMGFEDNKTEDFARALAWLGKELHREGVQDSFTVQVHAGETSKNPDNVNEVLRLALTHGFRVTIGHSLIGWNEETVRLMRRLAAQKQILVQLLHGSNVSLSATHSLNQLPLRLLVDNAIPFVVDTDGAIYNTHYRSLLASLAFAGADERTFDHIAKSQREYLKQRERTHPPVQALDAAAIDAIEASLARARLYTEDVKAKYRAEHERKQALLAQVTRERAIVSDDRAIADAMRGKVHIMAFGASGRSWADREDSVHRNGLSEGQRREIAIMQEMMVRALDPARVTFGIGRTKADGGAAEKLIEALQRHRDKRFFTVAHVVRPEDLAFDRKHELIFDGKAVKAIHLLGGDLVGLAPQIARIAAGEHRVLMLMGGLRSTDDIARVMLTEGAQDNLLLMRGEGISGVYAAKLPARLSFGKEEQHGETITAAEAGLAKLFERFPGIFMPGITRENVTQKLAALRREVEDWMKKQGAAGSVRKGGARPEGRPGL